MHLPLLHISNRAQEEAYDEDPLRLGKYEGRDLIPWLADPEKAFERAEKRIPALDVASLSMAAIGSEITYFAFLGWMFAAYDRPTGLAFASAVVPSVTINQIVKARFRYPRPPKEAMHPLAFVAPGDFTFPSGHAQNAVVLGLFLAKQAKRKWIRVLGLSIATTIPLSRIYLGVHYPRDVIAGTIIGVSTLTAASVLERPFTDWWQNAPRGPRGFVIAFAASIAGLLTGTPLAAFPLGVGGGLALGHDLSGRNRFRLDKPSKRGRIAQGIIGVSSIIGAGIAIRPLMKRESALSATLAGSFVGLALTFGVPVATNLARRINIWRENTYGIKKKRSKRKKR